MRLLTIRTIFSLANIIFIKNTITLHQLSAPLQNIPCSKKFWTSQLRCDVNFRKEAIPSSSAFAFFQAEKSSKEKDCSEVAELDDWNVNLEDAFEIGEPMASDPPPKPASKPKRVVSEEDYFSCSSGNNDSDDEDDDDDIRVNINGASLGEPGKDMQRKGRKQ